MTEERKFAHYGIRRIPQSKDRAFVAKSQPKPSAAYMAALKAVSEMPQDCSKRIFIYAKASLDKNDAAPSGELG